MKNLSRVAFVLAVAAGCNRGKPPVTPPPVPPAPTAAAHDPAERKDHVVLTERAAEHVRKLMQQHGQKYLRVSVSGAGQYKLDLDGQTDPAADYQGESRGVAVVVDRTSLAALPAGIVVDFVNEDGEVGFKFLGPEQSAPDPSLTLAEARRGFRTTLARREANTTTPAEPPPGVFRLVKYDAPLGPFSAYLTPDPKDGTKRAAIVWVTGGDCNTIDAGCWREGPSANDQSASAYRKAGIVMMFPALRGGSNNPGPKEGFLGEVDDVLAAAAFLRKQPHVDPQRIYLGGHSTGGTLALLVAECSDQFRAVFSFGPVSDVFGYGPEYRPFSVADPKELQLRSPGRWLHSIKSPTFVIEGAGGNATELQAMARSSKNERVRFFEVRGANHFSVLAPTNRLIAEKVLKDTGPTCNLSFTAEDLNKPFKK
jgi:dipeptidyl aminopeptidase/acylaminoacyl peptidase